MQNSFTGLRRLLDNKYKFVQHALYIGLILLFWSLFHLSQLGRVSEVLKLILYSSTYVSIAYLNIYYLFRKFLLNGKVVVYIIASIISFVISYITQQFIYFESLEKLQKDLTLSAPLIIDMLINAITYCMFIGIGLSMHMLKMWINSEEKVFTLEQENLKATLNNLKSQISPHFLFNTFNNLYVLTKTNPAVASEMVLGFADLMRYQLNESDKDKVNISDEIEYIENFLSLEKLRKDRLDLIIKYDKESLDGIRVEPLLFVTLIDNAVKHGSQQMETPFIHVEFERIDGILKIVVTNSKPLISILNKEQSLKKGIDNLRRRLELAYPNKHKLELIEQKDVFNAKLEIEL